MMDIDTPNSPVDASATSNLEASDGPNIDTPILQNISTDSDPLEASRNPRDQFEKMSDAEAVQPAKTSFSSSPTVKASTIAPTSPDLDTSRDIDDDELEKDVCLLLNESVEVARNQFQSSHLREKVLEESILLYQQKLVVALQEVDSLKRLSNAQPVVDSEQINKLRSEIKLSTLKEKELRQANRELETRMAQRDHTIATDAAELARLRFLVKEVPALRVDLSNANSTRIALENKLVVTERTYSARITASEEAVRTLNAEVVNLNTLLTKTRCEAEASVVISENAMRDANDRAAQATQKLSQFQNDKVKMQRKIDDLEAELQDLKISTRQLNDTFEKEISSTQTKVEINEKRASVAEKCVREVQEELAQTREILTKYEERRAVGNPLSAHADALLMEVEKALESKWQALKVQKEEMERARKSEMDVLAAQEKLKREKNDALSDAELHRKEVIRLQRQVKQQAIEIESLARQVEQEREPSAHPLDAAPGMGVDMGMETSPVAWRTSLGNRASNDPMDIGPASMIPTHYAASPAASSIPANYQTSFRRLSSIRREHQQLLESLRNDRLSFN